MQEEEQRGHDHWLLKLVSGPLAVTILINAGLVVWSYGRLAERVDALAADVKQIEAIQQGPTPAAAQAIASINQKDESQDRAIVEIRMEMRDSRRELLDEMRLIAAKLDKHAESR